MTTKTMTRANFVRVVDETTKNPLLRQAAREMPDFACNTNYKNDSFCVVAYAKEKLGYDLYNGADIDIDFAIFCELGFGSNLDDYYASGPEWTGVLQIIDPADLDENAEFPREIS